jgi:hypothetical protein
LSVGTYNPTRPLPTHANSNKQQNLSTDVPQPGTGFTSSACARRPVTASGDDMSTPTDQMSIWELRRCIAKEIAELRVEYGALMPPRPDRQAKLMTWRAATAPMPVAPVEHAAWAGRKLRPKAAVASPAG